MKLEKEVKMKISGKTVLVTGGASGLGKACIEIFHEAGANVMIADLNEVDGKALAASLSDRAMFVKTNITVYADTQNVCRAAVEKFGAVHVLVNCAGIGGAGKIIDKNGPYDIERYRNMINVNVIGTFSMTGNAAFEMVKNEPDEGGERGVIINIASVAAFDGQIGQSTYASTKGAIVSMTLPIARDLARDGVRVCTIAPGTFDTPLLARLPDNVCDSLGKAVPFPTRMGKPEECAAMAKAIVEIPYLNGETIRLDGAIRMPPR